MLRSLFFRAWYYLTSLNYHGLLLYINQDRPRGFRSGWGRLILWRNNSPKQWLRGLHDDRRNIYSPCICQLGGLSELLWVVGMWAVCAPKALNHAKWYWCRGFVSELLIYFAWQARVIKYHNTLWEQTLISCSKLPYFLIKNPSILSG